MPFLRPLLPKNSSPGGWRLAQSRRQSRARRRKLIRIMVFSGLVALAAMVGLRLYLDHRVPAAGVEPEVFRPVVKAAPAWSKKRVQSSLAQSRLESPCNPELAFVLGKKNYTAGLTLDCGLQEYLKDSLQTKHAKRIGIVMLEPRTGRILAMAGYSDHVADPGDPDPALEWQYPAASLFKIVTAAAAVDGFNMTPDSPVAYNGQKHTLYKSQLKNTKNRYTQTVTLEKAFAQSINPVFGKLGIHVVGRQSLEDYAGRFGFGRAPELALPTTGGPSYFGEKEYHLAEASCGFNRKTLVTPLQAALIASVAVNGGKLVEPFLVEEVIDQNGKPVYRAKPGQGGNVLRKEAAGQLAAMMEATITRGTARGAFRRASRDRVLKNLVIGGKTGSINDHDNYDIRYDLFAGFAERPADGESVALACVVAHEEYIGKRAAEYARQAFRRYFSDRPVKEKPKPDSGQTL